MTAFQNKQAQESRIAHRKANPIIATETFNDDRASVLMGLGSTLTCSKREDGRYLIQLRTGGSLPFQKMCKTIGDAREAWVAAKLKVATI